ncbi:SPOSA6832_02038, partial [Sporobolomyces salmonicolor]
MTRHRYSDASAPPAALAAHSHLQLLFPTADPGFLASSIQHYLALPPPSPKSRPAWTSEELVERVSDKMLEVNRGEWPDVAWIEAEREPGEQGRGGEEGIAQMKEVRKAWHKVGSGAGGRSRKGKGKLEREQDGPSSRSRERVPDVTLGRNIALVRLHTMFPLIPISDIRALLLTLEHSFLFSGAEALLARSLAGETSSNLRSRTGGANVSLPAFLARLFFRPRPPSVDAIPAPKPPDPVLTPSDLFRPPAQSATLIAHFEVLFPSLARQRPGLIREVVEKDGGSYASLRERLERRQQEAEGEEGAWMWGLFGVTGRGKGKGKQPERGEETGMEAILEDDVETVHPLIRSEVDEYRRRFRSVPALGPSISSSTFDNSADPHSEDNAVECECCFSSVPFSPAHLAFCTPSHSSVPCSPSQASISLTERPPSHHFCHPCLCALVRSYTFGQSPLPASGRISCPSTTPCTSTFSPAELNRVLPPQLLQALERRVAESQLEQAVLSLKRGAKIVSSAPDALVILLSTVLGALSLALLLLLTTLLVLTFPSRRCGALYASLYPDDSPASVPRATATFPQLAIALWDARESDETLPLNPALLPLLAPQRIPLLAQAWIVQLADQVVRRREGSMTVFRCRNTPSGRLGTPDRLALGRTGMVGVREVVVEADRDERDDDEVTRTERLVEMVWPEGIISPPSPSSASVPSPASASSSSPGAAPSDQQFCGRLSCLLCQSYLNPSAPSLHRCASSSSSSDDDELSGLRLAVEKAMSDASKRVCGRCGAGGVKDGGCNKGIAEKECGKCGKCSLYIEPDEQALVEKAAREARAKWLAEHPAVAARLGAGAGTSLERIGPPPAPTGVTNCVFERATSAGPKRRG